MSEPAPLPPPERLDLRARALYGGAVASDYALRTALASVAAAAPLPWVARGGWNEERTLLGHYVELAARGDVEEVFPAPPRVRVEATEGRPPGVPGGRTEILRFSSPYVASHPRLRDAYARHANNTVARAQHWRHADGPRPTLLVTHGFGASPARLNVAFFALKEHFANGWDVVLHTLPFHGSRRGRLAPVNGIELFAHGTAHLNEAILQGVHDARVLLDHLEAQGVPKVGATGLSLGGYTTALLASVEDRLDFAIPTVPVVWLPDLLSTWFPANLVLAGTRVVAGVDRDLIDAALAVHSPLTYAPVLPKDRLMIAAGLGDRLAPPEQSEKLWEHWDRPEIHWFPGSHVLHFGRGAYLAAVRRLMAG